MLNHHHSFGANNQPQQSLPQQSLSIDQFLRAAKLLEKHALEKLIIGQQQQAEDPVAKLFDAGGHAFTRPLLAKLGEEYQERMLVSKMRSANVFGTDALYAPNSTGSSRRSSPLSAPSPNSPQLHQQQQPFYLNSPQQHHEPTTSATSGFVAMQQQQQQYCSRSNHSTPSVTGRSGGTRGSNRQSRAAHNELEKNRRANLRGHLEALKEVLPAETDSQQRDTTLSLLTRARNHIRLIQEQKADLLAKRSCLLAEHLRLQGLINQQQQQSPINVADQQQTDQQQPPTITLPMPKPVMMATPELIPMIEKPEKKLVDLGFLEMQGLIPLLPQLYPYRGEPIVNIH